MANESPYTNDTSERNSGQSKPFRSVGEVAAGVVARMPCLYCGRKGLSRCADARTAMINCGVTWEARDD